MNDDYDDVHERREELLREPDPDEAACHDCEVTYRKEEMTARHFLRKSTRKRCDERWTKEERYFCDECLKRRKKEQPQPAKKSNRKEVRV